MIAVSAVAVLYAVKVASTDAPEPPSATTQVVPVAAPSPTPPPARLVARRPVAAPSPARREPPIGKTSAPTPVVVRHVVEEDLPKKSVDPIEGFDSGAAFDNPASPGRYGQRSSGMFGTVPNPGPGQMRPR